MYIYPNPELDTFTRTGCRCFTLVNDKRQSVGSMGMQVWMALTIVIYILISVLVAFLDKKKGFFGEKMFFWLKVRFLGRKLTKISIPQNGKRNPDPDVECKSQGVFLQFWIFTFLSFQ